MIKSFLKRVFSSSSEVSATVEIAPKEDHLDASDMPTDNVPATPIHKIIVVERNWVENGAVQEIEAAIKSCLEETKQDLAKLTRIRLTLEENLLLSMDYFLAKKLRHYLDLCEQETLDLTFFLDKTDKDTMTLYKTYLLPESVDQLNMFLQGRCMMIYETAENLGGDFRQEIEDFFQALDLPISPSFFDDFERFKEQVLNPPEAESAEEVGLEEQTMPEEPVPAVTTIEVSREEVENENIHQFDKFMEKALSTPELAQKYKGTLLFSFYGFGRHEDLLRMMNRKEIKDWASILVEKHPYIFYFLNDVQYPMTKFLTSLVVTTEVEDGAVYYNEDELTDFRAYIQEALTKLAGWLGVEETAILENFEANFQE